MDVVAYPDPISCLQLTEGEETENLLICHMNLLRALSYKGTRVHFSWVRSHCGIEDNEMMDHLAKETLQQCRDPLTNVHYAETSGQLLYSTGGSNQVECIYVLGRSIQIFPIYRYIPTLEPPKKVRHLQALRRL